MKCEKCKKETKTYIKMYKENKLKKTLCEKCFDDLAFRITTQELIIKELDKEQTETLN